ncbi:MAG: toprim domain-containing protein [Saprospiraceae bacterium]|nr:toprim domain-containing protein [Saprospiraceae bacterium]MCB9342633.1 toprim domain-containing protein [Lewinellaceae bacterium]
MNVKQAKQLDFPALLEKMGYQPEPCGIRKQGNEIWYKSPLAAEQTASFHLTKGNKVAWVFKCFSTGQEGTILDFVIAHEGYRAHDVKAALAFLRSKFPGPLFAPKREGGPNTNQPSFSFHKQAEPEQDTAPQRDLEYIEDLPLKSGSLLSYLENKRCIPPALASTYLRLVRYKNLKNNKTYYAFGMKNRAGGFEIRAASDQYSFKSALIARDITIIRGNNDQNGVLVFEGMTDFLSYLVVSKSTQPFCDTLILHSVNSYQNAADHIRNRAYISIHTFLDNDSTGRRCTGRFADDFGTHHISHSENFAPHKDVNAALKAGLHLEFFPDGQGDSPPSAAGLNR